MDLIVIPAYGRDYKSKAAVLKDWDDLKDFIIQDVSSRWDGRYVNKMDLAGETGTVWVRYQRLTKKMAIRLEG